MEAWLRMIWWDCLTVWKSLYRRVWEVLVPTVPIRILLMPLVRWPLVQVRLRRAVHRHLRPHLQKIPPLLRRRLRTGILPQRLWEACRCPFMDKRRRSSNDLQYLCNTLRTRVILNNFSSSSCSFMDKRRRSSNNNDRQCLSNTLRIRVHRDNHRGRLFLHSSISSNHIYLALNSRTLLQEFNMGRRNMRKEASLSNNKGTRFSQVQCRVPLLVQWHTRRSNPKCIRVNRVLSKVTRRCSRLRNQVATDRSKCLDKAHRLHNLIRVSMLCLLNSTSSIKASFLNRNSSSRTT